MKAIVHGIAILPDPSDSAFICVPGLAIVYDETGIRDICEEDTFREAAASGLRYEEVLDAGGNYVVPGFILAHIHGCDDADTMDASKAALGRMSQFLARTGVTSFLPTTMTCPWDEIEAALGNIRAFMEKQGGAEPAGAQVLGAHMEGPFISPVKKGSQDRRNILQADFARIAPFADILRVLTIAPEELPPKEREAFPQACREAGIRLSIGHTAADYEAAMQAVQHLGIRRFTHLYNAMMGFSHRMPGTVGAAFDTDAYAELIADNVHSHPMAQRLAYRMKGRDRVILITDSLRACGLGDGPSELGGQTVYVKGERALLQDGTIAGSVATMDTCLRRFRENTQASIEEVVQMATKNPACDLGIYAERGSIAVGKHADLTIFDADFHISDTIVGGVHVFHQKRGEER